MSEGNGGNGGPALTGRIFDIDAYAVDLRPQVKIRGTLYRIADLTLQERIRKRREYAELNAALLEDEAAERLAKRRPKGSTDPLPPRHFKSVEARDEAWTRYKVLGVALMLEGVPGEVAMSLTEREFAGVLEAVRRAHDQPVEVLEKNGDGATGMTPPPSESAPLTSVASGIERPT